MDEVKVEYPDFIPAPTAQCTLMETTFLNFGELFGKT